MTCNDNVPPIAAGKRSGDIKDKYVLGEVLGEGQFGKARKCTSKATGKVYACKTVSKRKLHHAEDVEDLRREVQIMNHLAGHPNIVKIFDTFEDTKDVHIVMELCTGGELFERIIQEKKYSEKKAADMCRTIVEAVTHMHQMGVMHRDLKPEVMPLPRRAMATLPDRLCSLALSFPLPLHSALFFMLSVHSLISPLPSIVGSPSLPHVFRHPPISVAHAGISAHILNVPLSGMAHVSTDAPYH